MSTVVSAPAVPCHWSGWEAVEHRFREPRIVGGWVCSALYSASLNYSFWTNYQCCTCSPLRIK